MRGRFNAWFFTAFDSYINWLVRDHKRAVFSELPPELVEVGPGVGANFRYLPPGCRLIAIEPNPYMHGALQRRAARCGIDVQIRSITGDAIDLDDQSVDAVISSLLLCTVADPGQVVSEIRRILRPGGRLRLPGARRGARRHPPSRDPARRPTAVGLGLRGLLLRARPRRRDTRRRVRVRRDRPIQAPLTIRPGQHSNCRNGNRMTTSQPGTQRVTSPKRALMVLVRRGKLPMTSSYRCWASARASRE